MPSSNVRALGALDLDAMARLHGLGFAPFGERVWTRQEMAELLASPGVRGCLLEGEDGATGFVLWRVAADESELITIAVHPDVRRRGCGGVLLETAIDGARSAGAGVMLLEVGEDNPAARGLYERRGFSTVGRRPGYYERGDKPKADALVMRLVIDSHVTPAG